MLRIRRIGLLGRAYRQFNRYRQILYVLFKYGFGDVIDMLKIDYYLEVGIHLISRKPSESVEKLTRAKRVRMVLEELGPTFIKLGQLLSSRSDLIPAEYHRELLKLQDQVPPTPYDQVREIIKSELGDYPEVLFHRFDETPLAGASIGSVHRAQLKSKEEVAIKIQRPGIRRQIETDLEIMFHLASLLERNIKEFKVHRPTLIVEEFAETLAKEIDYTMEASHIERFTRQLRNDKTVYVPKVYRHMSTEHVLTMEYIDGIKVSEIDTLREGGYDLGTIVERSASLIMKQLFVFGFFHADPHAGNIFVLPDNVICFLDFGMMGRVNREERENFTDMTLQVIRGEVKKVAVSMLKHTNYEKEPDRNQLERDLSALIDQHLYRPLKELDVAKLLHQLLTITTKHRLSFKPDLFLMMKALSTAEILGRSLEPDFDLTRHAEPFVKNVQLSRLNPKRVTEEVVNSGIEFLRFFMGLPGELQDILDQARDGKIKIEFEHHGLNPMLSTHDRIVNRVVFAIVLASIIVGSSLIVLSGVPPKWNNIPVIGLSGYIIAVVMAFWLLWSILRHGKM